VILESPLSVIVQDHIQAILLYGGVLIVFHLNRAVGGVLSILGQLVPDFQRGYDNRRFSSYWNSDSQMTYPLILAKIPVKNPWEIFAYLPFGGWNECPNTPELMAVVKGWFEQHGAMPAVMTHDELELLLPAPVPREKAMDVATELYGFCPDVVDQGPGEATVGTLADALRQSAIWYFGWD